MSSEQKVAAVTGGSSGIGRAIAAKLAAEGALVAVAGRNEQECRATVGQIEASGGSADFQRVDVADADQVVRWTDGTVERFGRLDWLVKNAGMNGRSARLEDNSDEELELIVRTNPCRRSTRCAERSR